VLLWLRSFAAAMLSNMPGYSNGHPDQDSGTQNENAQENSHSGQNNKTRNALRRAQTLRRVAYSGGLRSGIGEASRMPYRKDQGGCGK
jgi:hypothetical protein